ncbi:unnamed protein product [Ectocarpus sp. 6 AP-2014]
MTLSRINHVLKENGRRDILLHEIIMSIINQSRYKNDPYDRTWREIELELENTGYVIHSFIAHLDGMIFGSTSDSTCVFNAVLST